MSGGKAQQVTYNAPVFNPGAKLEGPVINQGATITGGSQHIGDVIHKHGVDQSQKKLKELKVQEELQEQNKEQFGTKDTMALLLSGWDKSPEQIEGFKQNQEKVQKMLTDHFYIKSENILTVAYENKESTTRTRLMMAIRKIKNLIKERKGNFLFYFMGHNSKGRKVFQLDDKDIDDDFLEHDELKKWFKEIKAPNKLFIIDTCFSGDADLPVEEEEEEWFPLLYEDEDEKNVLQWRSSQKDEASLFDSTRRIGHFTGAIHDVLSHHDCKNSSCRELRRNTFVGISDLHPCVCDHVSKQKPNWEFSGDNSNVHVFPLIAKPI